MNLVGLRFGKLTVLALAPRRDGSRKIYWSAICDCAKEIAVRADSLRNGHTTSCGCRQREACSTLNGLSRHPLFAVWNGMIARCTKDQASQQNFSYYGGRGIKVCDRWMQSFEAFIADVPERPSADHQLERMDNNGNYEPGNITWATRKEQGRNRRNNVIVNVHGRAMCLVEAVELLGLPYQRVHLRLRRGWTVERPLELAA